MYSVRCQSIPIYVSITLSLPHHLPPRPGPAANPGRIVHTMLSFSHSHSWSRPLRIPLIGHPFARPRWLDITNRTSAVSEGTLSPPHRSLSCDLTGCLRSLGSASSRTTTSADNRNSQLPRMDAGVHIHITTASLSLMGEYFRSEVDGGRSSSPDALRLATSNAARDR